MDCKLNFWITKFEKEQIEEKAKSFGFKSTSEYIRMVALHTVNIQTTMDRLHEC